MLAAMKWVGNFLAADGGDSFKRPEWFGRNPCVAEQSVCPPSESFEKRAIFFGMSCSFEPRTHPFSR